MMIGLVFPTDGPDDRPVDTHLDLIHMSGFDSLRLNFHHARSHENVVDWIEVMEEIGLEPLPIIDFDYDHPDLTQVADFAAWFHREWPQYPLEVGNEPNILHKMPARVYASVVKAVRRAVPHAQLVLAAERTKPIAEPIYTSVMNRLRRRTYYHEVLSYLGQDDYDIVDIHAYRNPHEPAYSPRGSRTAEWALDMREARGKRLIIGEDGWHMHETSYETIAKYWWDELVILQDLGVERVYVYAMVGEPYDSSGKPTDDWGVYGGSGWIPRPVAKTFRDWRFSPLRLRLQSL